MLQAPLPPGPLDRLTLTGVVAVALHALLLLGLGFDWHRPEPQAAPPTLDVVLVRHRLERPPEEADYLAQANQEGGGNVSEPVQPASAPPPASPPQQAQPPTPEPQPQNEAPPRRTVTSSRSTRSAPSEQTRRQSAPQRKLTASELMEQSMAMVSAQLEADLERRRQAYSQRPRQKYIDARTKEFLYASYMADWVRKVERVGNLNYPEEARHRSLSGALVLDVALNPDGGLNHVALMRSSGEPVLDEAAIRIVKLAAPFAPFPAQMRKDVEILHITKTWQFLNDSWGGR